MPTSNSIRDKESKRWLTGLISAELAIPSTTTVVTITDREGDIYDLFALERESNSGVAELRYDFLTRCDR